MPQKLNAGVVTITPQSGSPPTLYDIQIGNSGQQGLTIASLFDRTTFDEGHLLGNLRLHKLIGGFGSIASKEFATSINAAGVAITAGDFYSINITQNVDGSYTIGFAQEVGAADNQTLTATDADLNADNHDEDMIVKNVGAFLRRAGFHDLTTPAPNGVYAGKTAVQAVALMSFWF